MDPKEQENILIADLVECRHLALSRLMDFEEEQGNKYRRMAWEWFRDNNKWPSPRQGKRCRWSGLVGKTRWGYAWTRKCQTLKDAKYTGPSSLPYDLIDEAYMITTPFDTIESAIRRVIRGLATLFQQEEEHREWLAKQETEKVKQASSDTTETA